VLKPRPEPGTPESGFEAEDEFTTAPATSWSDEPAEEAEDKAGEAALYRQALSRGSEEEAGFEAEEHEPAAEEEAHHPFGMRHGFAPAEESQDEEGHQALGVEADDPFHDEGQAPYREQVRDVFSAEEADAFHEPASDPFREEPIPAIVNPYRSEAEGDDRWSVAAPSDQRDFLEPDTQAAGEAEAEPAFLDAPAQPARAAGPAMDLHGAEPAVGDAAVPRIGIHIFCELAETAAAAAAAAADRRMGRASTEVVMGGLPAAVQQYQNQPTPSLVIVESQDHGPLLIQLLDRLAEVCDPGTKVVVIGGHNDIALYRELMRRGVSEYLVPPIQTLQLIRAISSLYSDPSAPFIGRQIAFCGARGGVGSSTIAHNLAYTLSERMMTNTVIVDFDLPFGTAGLDFNQDPLQGVADALSQPDRLDPVLLDRMMARCTERLSLFAAPATLDDDYEISAEAFEEVAGKIRTTAPYIVLDLPHLWSNWMRKVLLTADDVVITAQPDLACLRNAKNIVDLMRQTRANDAPPWLVLNQVGVPNRPEIPTKDFCDALGLEPALILPHDPKLFGQAANNGQMIEELGDKSKAAMGLQQLAQILARREAPPAPKKSMLAGLFKRK
jgi:pilus assembly protein CpaE